MRSQEKRTRSHLPSTDTCVDGQNSTYCHKISLDPIKASRRKNYFRISRFFHSVAIPTPIQN